MNRIMPRAPMVEIRKAGFSNKGAQLMQYAVRDQLRRKYGVLDMAMAPERAENSASYIDRATHGYYQKASLWRYGIEWGRLAKVLPSQIREMYGIVLDQDIDLVLDAAGYGYTDEWGPRATEELAHASKQWEKQGTQLILLPQALGPFTSTRIRSAISTVADRAEYIFARDYTSYKYIADICGERKNILISPDFTLLLDGYSPDYYSFLKDHVAIIPNHRMVDRTRKADRNLYSAFIGTCIKALSDRNIKFFFLVMGGRSDYLISEEMKNTYNCEAPIIVENDPVAVKGIIGNCSATIGSRFHGLMNALSQGVPSIGTGWSHKYQALFDDFGVFNGVLDLASSKEEIEADIDRIVAPDSAATIRNTLLNSKEKLETRVLHMWSLVFEACDKSNRSERTA